MGYESKIYIVDKSNMSLPGDGGIRYAEVIAVFDMRSMGGLSEIFKKETDCYFYADDGNTKILKDKYGKSLTEATIGEVISYLKSYSFFIEHNRRIAPLLASLVAFDKSQNEWDGLTILHYGYSGY